MRTSPDAEVIVAAGAREISDGEVVVGGTLPRIVCTLAKRTHAPRQTFLLEIGLINADLRDTRRINQTRKFRIRPQQVRTSILPPLEAFWESFCEVVYTDILFDDKGGSRTDPNAILA